MNNINRSLGILGKVSHSHIGVLMSRNVQVRIILTVAAFSIVLTYQSGLLTDADALTRYYNCTTRAANKNGTLSLLNVDNCYDNVFKGAKAAEKEMQMLKIETTTK
ncbi:MAG TPA: hypothetical protein VKA91_11845 [Nitrososphaeraceae archaeon]|nr:hypothetical protein [Nitrososphaeraceae archaeon]